MSHEKSTICQVKDLELNLLLAYLTFTTLKGVAKSLAVVFDVWALICLVKCVK